MMTQIEWLDLSSCYGEDQSDYLYSFENLLVDEFGTESEINKHLTLREWLKK